MSKFDWEDHKDVYEDIKESFLTGKNSREVAFMRLLSLGMRFNEARDEMDYLEGMKK